MVRRGNQSDVKHVVLFFNFDYKKVYAVDWLISMVIKQIRLWNKNEEPGLLMSCFLFSHG